MHRNASPENWQQNLQLCRSICSQKHTHKQCLMSLCCATVIARDNEVEADPSGVTGVALLLTWVGAFRETMEADQNHSKTVLPLCILNFHTDMIPTLKRQCKWAPVWM